MDIVLITIALLSIFSAGLGISLLLATNRPKGGAELFGLSFLFGSAVVSLFLFILGFLLSGSVLRWSVTFLCVAIGMIGINRSKPFKTFQIWPEDSVEKCLLALSVFQISLVSWLSFGRVLGWDGLFNFESKARLAFLNGGVLPMEMFSDPSRSWTLQSYPLMLPLTESWLYLWLGREDQQLVKILFPMFFASALGLLNGGNRLLGVSSWKRLVAPLLILTVPLLLIGEGSASSGYADFPLAVVYLAAVIYLLDFWRNGDLAALRLAGAIAACGCWLKQEGAVLWFCVTAIATIFLITKTAKRREWLALVKASLPGLLIVAVWQLFVRFMSLPEIKQFSSVNPNSLQNNLWRVPVVVRAELLQLANWQYWGLMWLLVAATIVLSIWRRESKGFFVLPLAILLPFSIYSSVYIFSIWPSFVTHLESSFPRLLIHISLTAVLMVGAETPFRCQTSNANKQHLKKTMDCLTEAPNQPF